MNERTLGFAVVVLVASLLAGQVGGCASDPTRGYSTRSTYDESVRSVSVPMFDNATYDVGLEAALTEAIIKELRLMTPWIVTSPGNSETTLSGTITRSDMIAFSRESGIGLVQEVGVRLTVSFEWVDNRTGETLVSRRNFTSVEPFVPSRPSRERLDVGQQAVIQELARDIVAELRSNW